MSARNLTLKDIGLPVRAELRLESLRELINSKTSDLAPRGRRYASPGASSVPDLATGGFRGRRNTGL